MLRGLAETHAPTLEEQQVLQVFRGLQAAGRQIEDVPVGISKGVHISRILLQVRLSEQNTGEEIANVGLKGLSTRQSE